MNDKTKQLTEIAVTIALAVVCSFICVYKMPQGGSIALTMIPILFLSIRRGPWQGMIAGALYGLISLAIDGVVYHPLSILLDYVLAFGILGVCGFFHKNLGGIVAGCCVGVAGRFISSVLSGALLFASYAPEGENPWIYSLGYQATYMIPELIIAIIVLVLLYKKAHKLFEI